MPWVSGLSLQLRDRITFEDRHQVKNRKTDGLESFDQSIVEPHVGLRIPLPVATFWERGEKDDKYWNLPRHRQLVDLFDHPSRIVPAPGLNLQITLLQPLEMTAKKPLLEDMIHLPAEGGPDLGPGPRVVPPKAAVVPIDHRIRRIIEVKLPEDGIGLEIQDRFPHQLRCLGSPVTGHTKSRTLDVTSGVRLPQELLKMADIELFRRNVHLHRDAVPDGRQPPDTVGFGFQTLDITKTVAVELTMPSRFEGVEKGRVGSYGPEIGI